MHDAVVGGLSTRQQQWPSVPVMLNGLCSTVPVSASCVPTIIHLLPSRAAGVRQVQGLEKLLSLGMAPGSFSEGVNFAAGEHFQCQDCGYGITSCLQERQYV